MVPSCALPAAASKSTKSVNRLVLVRCLILFPR
jgi:hypothetical protein